MSVYGFDIVLGLIGLIVFIGLLLRKIRVENVRRTWAVSGIFTVLACYELFVSLDLVLTGVVSGRIALMVLAGWYLIRLDSIVLRRTLAAFVVSMVLSAGLGAAQFFTQDYLLSSKWLGMSPQDPSVLGVSVVEAEGGRWLRAHGTLPHPNALGGFSSIALILFFTLFATQARLSVERNVFLGFCRNVFLAVAPLILLAGAVTAVSRAAILATVAGGVAIAWQARRDVRYKALMPWIRGIAIAGLLIVLLAGPVAFTRLTAQGRLEALSFTKRIAAFDEAFIALRVYGWQGTGLGAATVALRELYPELPIWEIQPVHNIPVLFAVELGFGGLLLLAVLGGFIWFKIPNSKFQILNKFKIQISKFKTSLPLLICWLVLIMLDHYLWTLPAGLYVTGLVGWAGRGIARLNFADENSPRPLL